ncbi:hypothetical protein EM20IM_08675 [Candidatus Methylacidiphilum infernorum]|uniref:Zn-finger protein n=2 Tax=Candidatus Methylacidiphilum infernorum TaxID=511746 RepID=B3E0P0_METI4|nr:hypothetical protein [Candidatus Methylacidiphilum infernorum]ACD82794.1 Zn-finger protein [Methylacidiphilum infernorum V4]QSR86550.1 hypothetical protein EM20IM_08675 [Candidatus Methylacidiphilum infernorum]
MDPLEERAQRAAKIIASPGDYQVCESCGSIVSKKVVFCPNCNGYRFDSSRERVIEQAEILGKRAPTSISFEDYL